MRNFYSTISEKYSRNSVDASMMKEALRSIYSMAETDFQAEAHSKTGAR